MARLVPPDRWRIVLPLYGAFGAALALADPIVQPWVQRQGLKPGVVTAVDINLLLPTAMVVLAAWYPKVWTAVVGALLGMAGFILAHMLQREWHFWLWTLGSLAASTHPIQVVATAGYAVIGSVTAAIVGTVRRVGREEPGPRCASCGYSLEGLEGGVCPECGAGGHGEAPAGAEGSAGRSRYI